MICQPTRIALMTQSAISRFHVPSIDDLPDDLKTVVLAIQEKSGFVPNVFLAMAHRPDEMRAFFAMNDALMDREGNLTKAEKEMIVVTTSATNGCLYCVQAHGAILRIRARDPLIADQLAINYRKADVSPRQLSMLDFAMKVCLDSQAINNADFSALYEHGFDDDDIWDIGSISAFFGMSNRVANFSSMRPNDEFYAMGR